MFQQIFKHLEVVLKNSAAPRFFNLLLSVWISDKTLFLVFDILLTKPLSVHPRYVYHNKCNIKMATIRILSYNPSEEKGR